MSSDRLRDNALSTTYSKGETVPMISGHVIVNAGRMDTFHVGSMGIKANHESSQTSISPRTRSSLFLLFATMSMFSTIQSSDARNRTPISKLAGLTI